MVSRLTGMALVATLSVVFALPAYSNEQMWDFDSASETQSFSNGRFGNRLGLSSDEGAQMTASGWSDTGDRNRNNDAARDDTIENARLIWADSGALGIHNRDEDTYVPNDSIDGITSDADGEFDMLLLEFDTEVSLTGIDLSWATGGNAEDTVDISVLALDGSALAGSTWSNILANSGSVTNYNNVGLSYYGINSSAKSTRWLIGVYNPSFGDGGDAGDDGFLLDYVTTTAEPRPVSAPGSSVLVLLGMAGLLGRRSCRKALLIS
jgi:hypothetical protein